MSGREISYAWAARSIALGEVLVPIEQTQKSVLARMLDSADHEFIVSHLDQGRIARELALTHRAVAKVFSRYQCCPPCPPNGAALRETPQERQVRPGVRQTLMRTRNCASPGGRCRDHLGVLVSASVVVWGSTKKRAFKIAIEHFRDEKGLPLPMNDVHRSYERRSYAPMNDVHTFFSSVPLPKGSLEMSNVSANSAAALAKATPPAAAAGKVNRAPEGLEQQLLHWKFPEGSSRFTIEGVARLWAAAKRGKRDCSEEQVIHGALCLIEGARHKRHKPILDYPGFLISYIEGAMILPAIAQPCICDRRGTCDHCKAVREESDARARTQRPN
jgi:hypothetical protein